MINTKDTSNVTEQLFHWHINAKIATANAGDEANTIEMALLNRNALSTLVVDNHNTCSAAM